MKQKIRINESTLRKIVAESVKRTLNEIDWKTYASAADKSYKKAKDLRDERFSGKFDGDNFNVDKWNDILGKEDKHLRRAREFDDAASRALSDKYGRSLKTFAKYGSARNVFDDDAPWTVGTNAEGPEPLGYYYTSYPDIDWRDADNKEYSHEDFKVSGDIPYDREKYDYETDDEYARHKQNNEIGREVDDYTHRRYKYNNGWKLKK